MMFITKFNALIRNKILWSIFAFMVVVSFVAWQTRTGARDANPEGAVGKLNGKLVPPEAFRQAYFNSYLGMTLMIGRPLNVTEKVDQALKKMAWRRLVTLREVPQLKVTVGDDEVTGTIRQQPLFAANGQFSPERYQAFVGQFLATLNASESQFKEYMRQEILINKIRYLLAQAVWVAPLEINQVFHQLYDTFVISYATLERDSVERRVAITMDDAREYYEEHIEEFKVPEKMRVKYVAVPVEAFVDEGRYAEADLRAYYDEHIDDYTPAGTDAWASAQSFEEVEDDVRRKLAWEEAVAQAGDKAADFEVTLAPDRDGRAPTFEEAARAAGLPVKTSAVFALNERIPGLKVGLDFNKTAFELRQTPDEYFSHPVKGADAFYVLAGQDKWDARIPEFAEVKSAAWSATREQAVTDRLEQMGAAIQQQAAAALKRGVSFERALASIGLEVNTTEPFSVRTGLEEEESEWFYALVKAILMHNTGELTDPIPLTDGVMLAHIDIRQSASQTVFESIKADLAKYIKRRREGLLFSEWQDYLLAAAKFESLTPDRASAPRPPPARDTGSAEDLF